MTEPLRIWATMSFLTRIGAGRLGMSAVVMSTSASETCAASISASAALYSSLISLA